MKRDLKAMTEKTYDLLVIGGGITGACVLWDAALRGLKVALLDKSDFGAATSAATSKLIHGGLRYLKTMELGLVRESLQERRILEMIAPHLVYPMPFVFPAYGWGMRGLPAVISAMVFYDTLAYDRKWINDDDRKIPAHERLNAEEIIELAPGLQKEGLKGGVVYHDCQMYSPERLTLEFILSGVEYGADAINYAEVTELISERDAIAGVRARDVLTDEEYLIRSKVTINATGPWADLMLGKLKGKTHHGLVRSKGIHIITKSIGKDKAITLQTPNGRHFFIIPWRGHSLIGTTDELFKGNPDDFKVTEKDILDLLSEVNEGYPIANLKRSDVLFHYGGLRPIVEKETSIEVEVYDASRKYEIYDHEADDQIKGFITVIGGKYTTSRNLAEQLVDLTVKKLGKEALPCMTHTTPLYGGDITRYTTFVERAKMRRPAGLSDEIIENLCRNYGTRYLDVISCAGKKLEKVSADLPDIMAEAVYSLKNEMAVRLTDILFRRTGICTLGNPGIDAIDNIASIAAKELKWTKAGKAREIDLVLSAFETLKE
jgi:glycerol-3-phosphate dehydrogenase